jgi:FtsP/CotA-like multicopper oxidase with cupredoxin domain
MRAKKMNSAISKTRLLLAPMVAIAFLLAATTAAYAAAPGIKGTTFNLVATPAYISQPDGASIYSWGYGCADGGQGETFAPATTIAPFCTTMQVPGPTLIVTEGDSVTVTLTNNLPAAAGNTSILFPGIANVTATGGVPGLLTQEVAPAGTTCPTPYPGCTTVTYTFTAPSPGTRTYYSGTQSDLQVEMGLYGVLIVLPKYVPTNCTSGLAAANLAVEQIWGEQDYRLAPSATDHPASCYDREYLFQFTELDPRIHRQAEEQVALTQGCAPGVPGCSLQVATEPYHPAYFLINGRSMPDDMDSNYAPQYPHQPYNGNPHLHPGERALVRVVGQGRWQHPFHEHANHVRMLAHDGNMILSNSTITYDGNVSAPALAGPALFTTSTVPGQTADGIFYYTGRGLNWDLYGHNAASTDPNANLPCYPDANGYNTGYDTSGSYGAGNLTHPGVRSAINYYEWCQDHLKPLEVAPFGDVGAGGPATLPDPNILTNGAWYGGSPYLGPDATSRATFGACGANGCSTTGTTPPSGTIANPPSTEAGFSFMWHSHNEREITTNNIFPGGMLMMLLVDSREFPIDESY